MRTLGTWVVRWMWGMTSTPSELQYRGDPTIEHAISTLVILQILKPFGTLELPAIKPFQFMCLLTRKYNRTKDSKSKSSIFRYIGSEPTFIVFRSFHIGLACFIGSNCVPSFASVSIFLKFSLCFCLFVLVIFNCSYQMYSVEQWLLVINTKCTQ